MFVGSRLINSVHVMEKENEKAAFDARLKTASQFTILVPRR